MVIPHPPHWKALASSKDLVCILEQVLSIKSVMIPHVHRAKTFTSCSRKSSPIFTCAHTLRCTTAAVLFQAKKKSNAISNLDLAINPHRIIGLNWKKPLGSPHPTNIPELNVKTITSFNLHCNQAVSPGIEITSHWLQLRGYVLTPKLPNVYSYALWREKEALCASFLTLFVEPFLSLHCQPSNWVVWPQKCSTAMTQSSTISHKVEICVGPSVTRESWNSFGLKGSLKFI